jgi:hypothetical protein
LLLGLVVLLAGYRISRSKSLVEPAPRRRFPVAPIAALVIILMIPALVFAGSAMPISKAPNPSVGDALMTASIGNATVPVIDSGGVTKAGTSVTKNVTIPEGSKWNVSFTLTWTDEADGQAATNDPDTFVLHVTNAKGAMTTSSPTANPPGKEGKIVVSLPNGTAGTYTITVEMKAAGPQRSTAGPAGPLPAPLVGPLAPPNDTGNAWKLATAFATK